MARLSAAQIAKIYETELTPNEFRAAIERGLADEEAMAEMTAHVAWFRRRYPTALDRFRYARRMLDAWTRP